MSVTNPSAPSGWRAWAQQYTIAQRLGGAAMATGFFVTVALAIWGSSGTPPEVGVACLLAVASGLLQAGGVWAFEHGRSHPDPSHAQFAAQNLLHLYAATSAIQQGAEKAHRRRRPTADELRMEIGQISVQASFATERASDSVAHWAQFYPDAVIKARIDVVAGAVNNV